MGLWSSLFNGGGLVFYGGFYLELFYLFHLKWNEYDRKILRREWVRLWLSVMLLEDLAVLYPGDGCYGFHRCKYSLLFQFQGAHPSGVPVWNTPVIEINCFFYFLVIFTLC